MDYKEGQTPILIVSTGRCGSTLVSDMLRDHPDILSISEFWPNRVNLEDLFSSERMDGKTYWELLSVPLPPDIYGIALDGKISQVPKHCLHEKNYMRRIALPTLVDDYDSLFREIRDYTVGLSMATPSVFICKIFDFICHKLKKRVWLERTGASIDFMPMWRKLWPDASIIHIYRDGRDCAISMSKHHAFRLQILRKRANSNASFLNIVPLKEDLSTEEFYRYNLPLEDFGKLWNDMIIAGLDILDNHPKDKLFNLSYEQMTRDPRKSLKRLINFIDPGLGYEEWLERQLKRLHHGRSNWKDLDVSAQKKLTDICYPGLKRLRYLD